MSKGQRTRAAIVETALEQASAAGLEGLTIGALAERMKMSKSGVFAHFGSREDLQIAVLQAYEQSFVGDVLKASLPESRGLPRLVLLLRRWLARTEAEANRRGCIWISGASEYDDRPGAVRDELVRMIDGWRAELSRAIELAIGEGHLVAGTRADELIFNINGVILALHHDARLLRSPDAAAMACRSLDRLIDALRTDQAPPVTLAGSLATPSVTAAARPAVASSGMASARPSAGTAPPPAASVAGPDALASGAASVPAIPAVPASSASPSPTSSPALSPNTRQRPSAH